jgi:hypothetical protein
MGIFRLAFSLVALGAVAYVLFLVPVGGSSIATHAIEIWSSDLVQKKVAQVRSDVAVRIEQHLAEAAKNGSPKAHEGTTEADRRALTQLIEKADP